MNTETDETPEAAKPTALRPRAVPFHAVTHLAWVRTGLAAERTLMIWIRTSLTVIAFGFAMNELFERHQQGFLGTRMAHPENAGTLGLVLIIIGTVGTLFGGVQYWFAIRHLRSAEFEPNGMRPGLPGPFFPLTVAVFSALIGLISILWIAARS